MHIEQLEKFYDTMLRLAKEQFGVVPSKEVVQASILKRKAELVDKFPGERIASLSYQDLELLEKVLNDIPVETNGSKAELQVPANGRACGDEEALCKRGINCSNCQSPKQGQGHDIKVPEEVHNLPSKEGAGSGTGSAKKDTKHNSGKRPKGK